MLPIEESKSCTNIDTSHKVTPYTDLNLVLKRHNNVLILYTVCAKNETNFVIFKALVHKPHIKLILLVQLKSGSHRFYELTKCEDACYAVSPLYIPLPTRYQ